MEFITHSPEETEKIGAALGRLIPAGTVIASGWQGGLGYAVTIDHGNGFQTIYGHNSSLLVKVGDHVYKGQQIARMGSTGISTGNHCHFAVKYYGTYVDPLNYL